MIQIIEYPHEFGVIKDRHSLSPNFSINKERFSCSKCKNILFEPVQTECGCRFCQVCIPIIRIFAPDANKHGQIIQMFVI